MLQNTEPTFWATASQSDQCHMQANTQLSYCVHTLNVFFSFLFTVSICYCCSERIFKFVGGASAKMRSQLAREKNECENNERRRKKILLTFRLQNTNAPGKRFGFYDEFHFVFIIECEKKTKKEECYDEHTNTCKQ